MSEYLCICSKGMETNMKPVFRILTRLHRSSVSRPTRRTECNFPHVNGMINSSAPFFPPSLSRVAYLNTMLLVGLCLQQALM